MAWLNPGKVQFHKKYLLYCCNVLYNEYGDNIILPNLLEQVQNHMLEGFQKCHILGDKSNLSLLLNFTYQDTEQEKFSLNAKGV